MWLFTQYGFYSVVSDFNQPGAVIVRARSREHLELIKSRFDGLDWLKGREIIETPHADYRFRMSVSRTGWGLICQWLTEEIDYPNFKQRVYDRNGRCEYTHALSDVWETMFMHLQADTY